MNIYFKGSHVATVKGNDLIKVFKTLLQSIEYLSSPDIEKQTGVNGAGMHINNLRKRYNIRIDIDSTNKSKHHFKLKDGYKITE